MLALTWGGRVLSDRLLTNSVRSTREERLKVLKSIVNPSTTVYSCGSDAVSEALWSVFDVVSVLIWLFLQPACWPKSKEIKPCLIHAHCSEMFHYVERNKKNCTCYPELKAQVNDRSAWAVAARGPRITTLHCLVTVRGHQCHHACNDDVMTLFQVHPCAVWIDCAGY